MEQPSPPQHTTLQDRPPEHGEGLRGPGHMEVVRIRRRSRKHRGLLVFKGRPGFRSSKASSVQVTVEGGSGPLPAPWFDAEQGRIHLYYASLGAPELIALLAEPAAHACYLWTSADGVRRHAWLVKAR